jgi:hypothetical protein
MGATNKSSGFWLIPCVLASIAQGCGGDGGAVPEEDGGDVPGDATVMGCQSLVDCRPRQCEEPVACVMGECQFEPLVCGIPGRECPVQTCASTMQTDGSYLNQCQIAVNGGCSEGSSCEDNVCTAVVGGLRLRSQRFESGETFETAEGGNLRLRGHVGGPAPHLVRQASGGSALRLRGGIVTVRP